MTDYIKNLASNIPLKDKSIELDIVLEGGAFNGGYEVGIMLLIKELEKRNYLKVNRISGCSIGSVVAVYYFLDILQYVQQDFKKIREYFKKNFHIKIIRKILENRITNENFNRIKKNKLYITYSDVSEGKQIVKSKYKNKEDLISSLIRSCHLPFFSDDTFYCEEEDKEYFDGFVPYIFPEREIKKYNKQLYVSLSSISLIPSIIYSRHETNISARVLNGALDAYNLFIEKPSYLCSYVNDWTVKDFAIFRLKEILHFLLFYILNLIHLFIKNYNPTLNNYYLYRSFGGIINRFYKDFILYISG